MSYYFDKVFLRFIFFIFFISFFLFCDTENSGFNPLKEDLDLAIKLPSGEKLNNRDNDESDLSSSNNINKDAENSDGKLQEQKDDLENENANSQSSGIPNEGKEGSSENKLTSSQKDNDKNVNNENETNKDSSSEESSVNNSNLENSEKVTKETQLEEEKREKLKELLSLDTELKDLELIYKNSDRLCNTLMPNLNQAKTMFSKVKIVVYENIKDKLKKRLKNPNNLSGEDLKNYQESKLQDFNTSEKYLNALKSSGDFIFIQGDLENLEKETIFVNKLEILLKVIESDIKNPLDDIKSEIKNFKNKMKNLNGRLTALNNRFQSVKNKNDLSAMTTELNKLREIKNQLKTDKENVISNLRNFPIISGEINIIADIFKAIKEKKGDEFNSNFKKLRACSYKENGNLRFELSNSKLCEK